MQEWIGALLRLTAGLFKECHAIDFGSDVFEEQGGKRVKVEGPTSEHSLLAMFPVTSAVSFPLGQHSSLHKPTPPLCAPPPLPPLPPPPPAPNPLAPAQLQLAFLPLFNQTASQRGLSVEYPATFVGPAHAGQWNVSCVGELDLTHRKTFYSMRGTLSK